MGGEEITHCNALRAEYEILMRLRAGIHGIRNELSQIIDTIKEYTEIDKERADELTKYIQYIQQYLNEMEGQIRRYLMVTLLLLVEDRCAKVTF